jgi:hypothetical protein
MRCSVEIEIAGRLSDWFGARLPQGLFEPARQRVTARLFGLHRLLEDRFAPRSFLSENAVRLGQLWTEARLGFAMTDHASEVGIDDERRRAARTGDLELRLQLRHTPIIAGETNCEGG